MSLSAYRLIAATAAAALALSACSEQQEPKGNGPTQDVAQAVALEGQPDIAAGVQALPRLVGEDPAIAAINADLTRIDTEAKSDGCDGGPGFERTVTEPMTGPGYFTVYIAKNYACEGAAHPSTDEAPITWDLATGQRVDWAAALPGLAASRMDLDGMPADFVPSLQSAVLAQWYSAKMMASDDAEWLGECRDILTPEALAETYFKVWLDAQNGGVSVSPEFAHVAQACAETGVATETDLKAWGVSDAMLQAVKTAHAAENFGPKG